MFALSEGETIAAITAGSTVCVALIAGLPSLWNSRRTREARDVAQTAVDAVGTPNGRGNVVQMLIQLLERQEHTSERMETLGLAQVRQAEQIAHLTGRLDAIEKRPGE